VQHSKEIKVVAHKTWLVELRRVADAIILSQGVRGLDQGNTVVDVSVVVLERLDLSGSGKTCFSQF
jgi:hypothetical protein